MTKEKLKNFIVTNKKILVILVAILAIFAVVSLVAYADNNDEYAVEIKDDGSANIAQDGMSSITKKIVEDTSKSLTYEVKVNNLNDATVVPEVAVVVDTSRSVETNDVDNKVKEKATQLVTELLNEAPRAKISLVDNTGVKVAMNKTSLSTYTTAINNLTYTNGKSVEKAIEYANSTYTGAANTKKYLVLISDATDSVKTILEDNVNNGVKVYSILANITNSEYKNGGASLGKVTMIKDVTDFSSIYNSVNDSLVNVKVTDVFSAETLNYFDFSIISNDSDLTVTTNSQGYTLDCAAIKAGESKTLKFKLDLKTTAAIDAGKIYRTLNTSDNMKLEYKDAEEQAQGYDMVVSPTYVICKKYSLTIEAVSEKSDKLPIKDLSVRVVGTIVTGKDINGDDITKTIYDETLITDSNGKIKIDELKTLGDITFEIIPNVNQFGYVATPATKVVVHNDPTGVGSIWAEADRSTPEVDVVTRNINVKLPISVQTFALEVETIDLNNTNIKLGNIEYRLIQPKLNSKYDMEALFATTAGNGKLTFNPTVMTKDGTYQYILSQMTEQTGYDPMGNVTLLITFEGGKVTKIVDKYNDKVTSEWIDEQKVKVTVGNVAQKDETFFVEVTVSDKENNSIKIQDAIYDIEWTRVDSSGTQVTSQALGQITDKNGKITLELPGTGNIKLTITEVKQRAGYVEDKDTKEVIFFRNNGTVQYITKTTPLTLDAVADKDNNAVIVNLESQPANEQNRIQVHLVDNGERDVNIPNVLLALTNTTTNKVYTAMTGADGIANFIVEDEDQGTYEYKVELLSSTPYGYSVVDTNLATIEAKFDTQKHICEAKQKSYTVPYIDVNYKQMPEDKYVYDTAVTVLGLTPDTTNSYNLKINLLDGSDLKTPIQDAQYSIDIISDTATKEIRGRKTDSNGNIETRIIGGDKVTIKITQTYAIMGYIINDQTQTIELRKTVSGYVIDNQEPNTYDPANGNNIGAEIVGRDVIYHDVNAKKTGANTILNLYINKVDTNDYLVAGVKVVLSSPTLVDSAGKKLDEPYDYVDPATGATKQINYRETDNNGYLELLGIQVDGEDLNNGERVDYLYTYEVDDNGVKKANTDMTFKLTFRYNPEKAIIEITNVEATWGNRLMKKKDFSGYESSKAYESNVYLDLYTNYDDVGNFSLDLKKVNKDGTVLPGSKYDVTVTRLDGTRLVRRDIEVGDNVEFEGFTVAVGTNIEITEKVAPIGYDVNEYTEILTVEAIDELTGDVTVKLEKSSYKTPRASIASKQTLVMSDGTYKTCITLELTDYETNTFKFGIQTLDATTSNPVSNYTFKVTSDQGAQTTTNATNKDGKTTTKVGANYSIEGYEVEYTIDTIQAANYYKKLASPIKVKVVFDMNGKVNAAATNLANTGTTGYGSVWSIGATNTVGGNDIDIIINVDPQDPLVVNIQSVDIASGTQLTNVQYKVEPSLNLPAEGTTKLEVGYVVPNGIQTYTLKQTNSFDNYMPLDIMKFKVTYDKDGNVSDLPECLTEGLTAVSYTGKEITLKVDMMPELPFVIKNTGYFDGLNIANAKFEITSAQNLTKEKLTDKDGQAVLYVDKLEQDTTVRYTVKQLEAGYGYATVEDFQIDVTFDANRNVTNAQIVGDVNKYVNFVEVTVKAPSTTADEGYNGNDKGIINISVKNYPDVQMQIENVDLRDESIKLAGATYKIVSSINTKADAVTTDSNGIGTGRLDKSGYQETVTYTITQVNPSARYQSLAIPVVIEVDFDNTGYIINTPRVIKRADIATASIPTYSTITDKFKVNVQIKSNPELAITINKVDTDTGEALGKVDFEVTARIAKSNLANYTEDEIKLLTLNTKDVTEEEYLSQVLDRLKINPEDVETIKQDIGIQNLINELKATGKLTADEEDQINACVNNSQKINKIVELNKATKTQVNAKIKEVTNQNVVDKLIAKGTTSQDRVDDLLALVKDLVRLDVDNITTDSTGIAIAYMDKTLANKTIEYTIKETKKADGYDWLDEVVIIEITYDAQGKMVSSNPIRVVSGDIDVTNYNADDFTVEATIKNKPSDEVRIHLSVEDVYDSNKKLETAIFDTYLVDTRNSITFSPDDKYRLTLESGSTTTTTGLVTAHGEDTETMGVYEEGAGTRILRLVQKQTPDTYYIGNDEYKSAYQSIQYALLVSVTFNDEGSVTGVSVYNPGGDTHAIGYAADNRYLQVTHTRNTINVTVRYYPMLQVQMQAVDMYTGDSLKGQYTISTTKWGMGAQPEAVVSSGYIDPSYSSPYIGGGYEWFGRTYSAGYKTDNTITTINDAARVSVLPTESDTFPENKKPATKERILYIYENAEPNSPIQYQTYLPRYIGHSYSYLLARIKVKYDDIGQVKDVEILEKVSNNNIKDGFFTSVKATVNEHTIQIKVEYAPITTVTATVIDEVSGAGLSGIRIDPYLDGNFCTNTSYEYRTTLYYTTGSNGKTGWTYWGASVPDSLNRYVLDTYTTGSGYDGYFDPQNVILDVAYDSNGRIASVTPKSTDQFGDVNAIDISWENNHINVTIRYSRKFNVKLNKVDYYDSNTRLNAGFKIISNEGTIATAASNSSATIGKVYAGKKVKYTLSETAVPSGYIPITNLEFLVEFNNNGSIRSATSTSEYYEFLKVAPVDSTTNSLRKIDLEANIKNKPRFDVNINLTDEFYSTLKLEGGLFTITNSKGDVDSGGVQTDVNGTLTTYVGTVYPNEEVTYTVKQTNTIAGYYDNTTVMEFKVKFNENGKIETYTVTSGGEVMQINPTKHVGTKAITLNITNKPKDVKLGIYKYDELTNSAMENVKFKLKTEVVGGATSEIASTVTNADGTVTNVVDNFVEQSTNRVVKYTISEIEAAKSYRKIQDVVLQVTYKEDGTLYLYDVLSNPSNVKVEVAVNKQIKYVGDTPVHIKLSIPNDNAYDLIIKDEDKNYPGLGIEGTIYDVSINGAAQTLPETDANGITQLTKQTQNGDIEFVITERSIGEGYREDNNNTATIRVNKGVDVYSLTLNDNSNPTYADVEVDEEHGTITVTFKNETKLEMTMLKNDINTGKVLPNAVFEITSEEVDSTGNAVAGTLNTITTSATNTTDANGLLYFDLGLSHQNKTIKYTFTETTPPSGYDQILPIEVTVKFDAYGNIISMTDDSFRAEEFLATTTGKSHHMVVQIGNGTLDPKYTVKVVTEDSQSGKRINGSIFQVEALEKDTGATNKSVTGATKNESVVLAGNKYVFEKGALRVRGITAENNVKINISQIETATGYVYGSNLTAGTVEINAEFVVVGADLEKDVKLSLIDDGGFDVEIDNINREITIKVKNDPDVVFEITKVDSETGDKLKDAKFTITSAIEEKGITTSTGFTATPKLTNKNGYTESSVGYAYNGKTVIYTLEEEKMEDYNKLDNIIIKVTYDANGNILDSEVLSNVNDVTIADDSTKTISKRVMTESDKPGIVEIDYSSITIPTGKGSRILQMTVKNTETPLDKDYQIKIEKHHESSSYPYYIPGVTYQITVTQEYGKNTTTWTDITNDDGVIISPYFSGYGYITVEITEISAPEGYKVDNVTRTAKFYRNENSKRIVLVNSDIGFKLNDDFTMVTLQPTNKLVSGKYDIIVNKVDQKTGMLIANNPAGIELDISEEYETITQVVDPTTGNITETKETTEVKTPVIKDETDEAGRIVASAIDAPTKEGVYKYYLRETKTPKGYKGILEKEVEIDVEFGLDSNNDMVIKSAVVKDATDVKVAKVSDQLISLMVYNRNQNSDDDTLEDGEFGFKINKVDTDLYNITTGVTEFTITDRQTGDVKNVSTDTLGEASLQIFTIPDKAGNYKYTINEVTAPEGYKLDTQDIDIMLEFKEDTSTGDIYLASVKAEGNVVYEQPEAGKLPNRKIELKIINEDEPYQIVIEKHHEENPDYPTLIPGVDFDVTIEQEYGGNIPTWSGTTNAEGIITSDFYSGYGYITIKIKEKSAPDKYQVDYAEKTIKVYRDKETKKLRIVDSDVGYEFSSDNKIIYLKPTNELIGGIFDMVINKMDKDTNTLIANNPAKLSLYMLRDYYQNVTDPVTGAISTTVTQVKELVTEGKTDDKGRLIGDAILMPSDPGEYTFILEETQAPYGYKGLQSEVQFKVKFELNASNELVITDVNVVSGDGIKILKFKDQLITLAVENESTIPEDQFALNITKVDETGNTITSDTAVFKLTDNQTKDVYYLETEDLKGTILQCIQKPDKVGKYTYTLNEIKAPEGYALDRSDISIELEFADDGSGKIYLQNVNITGTNVTYANAPLAGELPSDLLELKITNIPGSNGDANDKPYTVILNKKDSITKDFILDRATFDVSLVNGEIVHAATNTDGQIIIENVFMPSKPGEYEIVVKELTAPDGYYLDTDMKIAKVTFTGTGDSMVITDIQLDSAHNSNIEIVTAECTEDKIVLNVLNEKEDDDLYVISKKDSAGEDIYDVMKEYAGKQYKIDKPFIDTRVAKSGNNIKVQEFMDNLESNGVMTVWDKDGNQIDPASKVKTGYILKSTKGSKELTFEIVVKGDIDGDGRVRSRDLDMLIKHLAGGANSFTDDPIKMRAADIVDDGNGRVRSNDLNEFYKVLAK